MRFKNKFFGIKYGGFQYKLLFVVFGIGIILEELPKNKTLAIIFASSFLIDLYLNSWIRKNYKQLSPKASRLFLQILSISTMSLIALLFGFLVSKFSEWSPFWKTYTVGTIVIFIGLKCIFAGTFFAQFLLSKIQLSGIKSYPKTGFYVGLLGAFFAFLVMLYGTLYEAFDLRVQRVHVRDSAVPKSFDQYKIVQFSDLHIGSQISSRYVKKIVDSVNSQNADLVVFTGDLVNLNTNEVLPFIPILSNVRSKDGVFVIFGNHDYGGYLNWKTSQDSLKNVELLQKIYTQKLKWKILQNESVYLRRGGDSIILAGVGHYNPKKNQSLSDLKKALSGVSANKFTILLSHNPQHFEKELSLHYPNVNLSLSGHSHGGQVAFKIGKRKIGPAQFTMRYWAGFYHIETQYLNVNTGIGFNVFPFRIGVPPSISVISLRYR